jgi:hypothetical protein
VLVDCAESFQRIGEKFIPKIRERFPEGSSLKPRSGLGNLVCCAANLGFSLELYLKALHSRTGKDMPYGHDLLDLYTTLPARTRKSIEVEFDGYVNSASAEARGYASISVAKGPETPPTWSTYAREPKDLKSLLRRSRDVYNSWRYLFEVRLPDDGSHEIHQFEYLLLHFACQAINAELRSKLRS